MGSEWIQGFETAQREVQRRTVQFVVCSVQGVLELSDQGALVVVRCRAVEQKALSQLLPVELSKHILRGEGG